VSTRTTIEYAVRANIKVMERAAAASMWSAVENASRVIESLLRVYERMVGAERIE
jgi:hypothetical protein